MEIKRLTRYAIILALISGINFCLFVRYRQEIPFNSNWYFNGGSVSGALGYLWLAGFWFTYYNAESVSKETKAPLIPLSELLRSRFVTLVTNAKFFIDPIWYFITFWTGRYLADVYNWDLVKIGWFAMLPFLLMQSL